MEKFIKISNLEAVSVPPVEYESVNQNNSDIKYTDKYLGHLFPNKIHAQREIEENKMLKNIDPHKDYTFQSLSHGKISADDGKFKYQIIYPNNPELFCSPLIAFEHMGFDEFVDTILFFMKNVGEMNSLDIFHLRINEEHISYNSRHLILYDFKYLVDEKFDIYALNLFERDNSEYWESPEISMILDKLQTKVKAKSMNEYISQIFNNNDLKKIILKIAHEKRKKVDEGKEISKHQKKFLDFFTNHAEWYKNTKTMQLMEIMGTLHVPPGAPEPDKEKIDFYEKFYDATIEFMWSTIQEHDSLQRLMNTDEMLCAQDSWGLGMQMLIWLYVFSLRKLSSEERNVLDIITNNVCDNLLNVDILKRLKIIKVYNKIKSELSMSNQLQNYYENENESLIEKRKKK